MDVKSPSDGSNFLYLVRVEEYNLMTRCDMYVFSFQAIDSGGESKAALDALLSAKKSLLSVMPRIIVAMASLWRSAVDAGYVQVFRFHRVVSK